VFEIKAGKGLLVESHGVPIIQGSLIQFFKPGWSKGYFSTAGNPVEVDRLGGGGAKVSFRSENGLSQGTVTYQPFQDHLRVHYDLLWSGDEPANAEICSGFLWAPVFRQGILLADGKPGRSLAPVKYSGEDIGLRRFSPDATSYSFAAPIGVVSERSSIPLTLFDGRGSQMDWARSRDLFWLGTTDLPLPKGVHVQFDVDYEIDLTPVDHGRALQSTVDPVPTAQAMLPDMERPPLIPKPQTARLDWDHPLTYTGALSFPAGEFDHLDLFKRALARRFKVPVPTASTPKVAMDGGISKLGYVPGGYAITITDHSLSVLGEEDDGLRNGLERLAAIAFVHKGKICFPTGTVLDQPQTTWRGVHLFVGKQALPFQRRLWTRVLRPLGFDKVVLECERTHWDSLPGIDTDITMPKSDLVDLFSMYRSLGVEPIPLIESYGHMRWLFANEKNLDVAADPQNPAAIDPANPKSADLLGKLWDEAIAALHPTTVHFGLDEVDLVGKKLPEKVKTELWAKQLGVLEHIARRHDVKMMLWGDQALAPADAPDAALAETEADATDRRDAIPKGSLIGDWHYLANPDPTVFRKTLQTWKDAGMSPIATTWYRPDNIAGFDAEAGLLDCGTLQTTWCGYESSEANVLDSYDQFSAMILAADYGWSARRDLPSQLDYDPATVFHKMYFGGPSELKPLPGADLPIESRSALPLTVGRIRFGSPGNLTLASDLQLSSAGLQGIELKTHVKASKLAFALNTLFAAPDDGAPVAEILVVFADGKQVTTHLKYGENIRSLHDPRGIPLGERNRDGVCCITVDSPNDKTPITEIAIRMLNVFTGLSLKGVEAID
jgi:hypothetical protein